MAIQVPSIASGFAQRLSSHAPDALSTFVEAEIISGRPFIFATEDDLSTFQQTIATALGIAAAPASVRIVGSARTGFSLNPVRYFEPFRDSSDIDVAVVHEDLFDDAWDAMLSWDYASKRTRGPAETAWLKARRKEVWSGWYYPNGWDFRNSATVRLSFPESLRSVRDFSHRWYVAFRSLSRYRHHAEIPRHNVKARLYRSLHHLALYHTVGLRTLRADLGEQTR